MNPQVPTQTPHSSLYMWLKAKFDRYLRGVDPTQAKIVLGAFYSFAYLVLTLCGLSQPRCGVLAAVFTAGAGIVYLMIPKDARNLVFNLAEDSEKHPEIADQVAHVFASAIEKRAAGASSAAASAQPTAAAPIANAEASSDADTKA